MDCTSSKMETPLEHTSNDKEKNIRGLTAVTKDLPEKAEAEVRAKAEAAVASGKSLFAPPKLRLDPIWHKDDLTIDLPTYVKSRSTTMSFPEKLMLMMIHLERTFSKAGHSEQEAPICWKMDGRALLIQGNRDELVRKYLPEFFPQAKFSSLTRKLYRWQFRQIVLSSETTSISLRKSSNATNRPLMFTHAYFQRDHPNLMGFMESITASGLRKKAGKEPNKGRNSTAPSTHLFASHHSQPPQALSQASLASRHREYNLLPVNERVTAHSFPSLVNNNVYLSFLSPHIPPNAALESWINPFGVPTTADLLAMGQNPYHSQRTLSNLFAPNRSSNMTHVEPNLVALANLVCSLSRPLASSVVTDPSLQNQSGGRAEDNTADTATTTKTTSTESNTSQK